MTEYRFPAWRRVTFLALLIITLTLALAPSVTKGNINVRAYALLPQGVVKHLYTTFTGVQLHVAGLPEANGWITINQNVNEPKVDLVPQSNQLLPSQVLTTSTTSGRYDMIKMTFSNSTLILTNGAKTNIATGPLLTANATISIPPNGNGDVLFILSLDYAQLISANPTITAAITQVTAF